jgi:arabinose-5-phosphate isomerase
MAEASIVTDPKSLDRYLERARELLKIEASAIEAACDKLGPSFPASLECIRTALAEGNKLVLMGVGKSHYVAHKLAASFMSTGVTAIFVHPSEALHGDLGSIRPGDVAVLFSKSGSTPEVLGLIPFLKGRNPVIAITGGIHSPLARQCDFLLDASVEKEACPINMLPTASTTVALALGDALMACLAEEQGFSKKVFAGYHPGGSIGKRLNFQVKHVLNGIDKCAHGSATLTLKEVAQKMGEKPLGVFCAVSKQGLFEGLITDGDLRRAVARGEDMSASASKLLNTRPITLQLEMLIDDAIGCMELQGRRVNCAPVIDESGEFLGLVHIHDLI